MNLTRDQLSADCGVSPSTIRNLEFNTHAVSYIAVASIAEALGLEIELMDIDAPQEID